MDGIEKDLQGRAKVFRFNMLTSQGREFAERYDVKSNPTTIVLDNAGKVIYRHSGIPDRRAIVKLASAS